MLGRTLDLFLVPILSYSPILYNLLAFRFLGSIAFSYTYSISLVYNLTLFQFLYMSLQPSTIPSWFIITLYIVIYP
jgi:hypothetical protein